MAMYVNIGADIVMSAKNIIGVFDLDLLSAESVQPTNLKLLKMYEDSGFLHIIGDKIPRMAVLTLTGVWLSPLSPETLRQRLEKS
ncbi:MAG: DUF370 domain-containing protein [Clostridiaceae bacterium]|nr:DUF370 domain-containing protein [Clostridiaceae bacterium]